MMVDSGYSIEMEVFGDEGEWANKQPVGVFVPLFSFSVYLYELLGVIFEVFDFSFVVSPSDLKQLFEVIIFSRQPIQH